MITTLITYRKGSGMNQICKQLPIKHNAVVSESTVSIVYAKWASGVEMTNPDVEVKMEGKLLSFSMIPPVVVDDNEGIDLFVNDRWLVDLSKITTVDQPEIIIFEIETGIKSASLYRHHSGKIYQVITLSNMKVTKPEYKETVTYRDIESGTIYSRPLEEFTKSFTAL
ncbi:hypothetical protein KODAMA_01840 [Serratia phage vB_SmaM-Kodama]|nr:hypothetical protein KODAMA_01840 [Serratia phage vB_SmaM-Kodama]